MTSPIGEAKVNKALSFVKTSEKSRRNLGEGGFTLIEILLVVVILGIVLSLAAPNFSKEYSRFQLNKTADDLVGVCRWAQAMAIGQEHIYALSFSVDHHSYNLTRAKDPLQNEASGIIEETDDQNSFEPVKGSLGLMHSIPDDIRLVTHDDRIGFYPDGTIDPATIQLNSLKQKIVLSSIEVRGMMTKVNND